MSHMDFRLTAFLFLFSGVLVSNEFIAPLAYADPFARITAESSPFTPNDPYFPYDSSQPLYPGQWNLVNKAPDSIHFPASQAANGLELAEVTVSNVGLDMNVQPAWTRGYTGKGITIGILDDGIEMTHPDLDVIRELSTGMDANGIVAGQNGSHEKDSESHGTTVAGMAAAIGGNGIGVTGSAPHARLASIRVNNFTSLDDYYMHAPAIFWQGGLGWENGMDSASIMGLRTLLSAPVIPIKNSSSKVALFSYPPRFAESYSAFARTAANGLIFTQAAGNSRRIRQQDIGTNMETSSPYVIGVSAVGSDGKYALYSNFGSAVAAATLSESANWALAGIAGESRYANGLGVSSTDRFGALGTNYDANTSSVFLPDLTNLDYTSQFDGTSAATPSLSGILALAKQANPLLNTRMTKHLLARTSRMVDLRDASSSASWTIGTRTQTGWLRNRAGFHFNPNYGFGLVDASKLIERAVEASYVTAETIYSTGLMRVDAQIPAGKNSGLVRKQKIHVPHNIKQNLESVEVYLKISGGNRDEWQVVVSKGRTSSRLWTPSNDLPNFDNALLGDPDTDGGIDHGFLTHSFWGEDPDGEWTVTISNPTGTEAALFEDWGLVLHMGDIKFDKPGVTRLTKSIKTSGFSKNRKASRFIIEARKTLLTAGDVQINGGEVQVDGRLAPADKVLVSKLDTSMQVNTEELSYGRGVQIKLSGGTLSGLGRVNAPSGLDGVGGVLNAGGTVRPSISERDSALHIGTQDLVTSFTQPSGTLHIDVQSTERFGKLIVSGPVVLGGTLHVVTKAGLEIKRGTRLNGVLRGKSISGTFTKVSSDLPGTRLHWEPIYTSNRLDLIAVQGRR